MKFLEGVTLESLKHALAQLRQHKLRTSLTLLGMVFGVGAVIAMLSIGEGAKQEAMRLIESMGLRNLLVQSRELDQETLREVREHSIGLSRSDVRSVLETMPNVTAVSDEKKVTPAEKVDRDAGNTQERAPITITRRTAAVG